MSRKTDGTVIPGVLRTFLEDRGTVGIACTRSAALKPRVHYLSAWHVADEGRELVCLVQRGFTTGLLENLRDNGRFSATIEQIGPHETYQFKGTCIGSRPAGPGDLECWERARERFAVAVKAVDPRLGLTHEQKRDYIAPPEVAIRMRVDEIFLQTPGPGAGRRLFPAEGE